MHKKNTTPLLYLYTLLCATLIIGLITACNSQKNYTPKPRGYPRVTFPAHAYQPYANTSCPFTFEYPQYAQIVRDSMYGHMPTQNPCWFDLVFPDFNARLHLSYKPIQNKNLPKLLEDAHTMNAKHVIKADYIDDSLIITPNKITGIYYKVAGNAASSTQFALTDTTHHFLWGSLYFKNQPQADSLQPIITFLQKDIAHLLNTFNWK